MQVRRITRDEAEHADGVVVAIDVIRAFTVAAYALHAGARRLWLVRTPDEARTLHRREPEALLAGEVGGYLIPGFHLNNSPFMVSRTAVAGRTIIQRTGAGTQGAVAAARARTILVASLVNAAATAAMIRELGPPVYLLPTGSTREERNPEDDLCAGYIEALLFDRADARHTLDLGLDRLRATDRLAPFTNGHPDFPPEDITHAFDVDRFTFAMQGTHASWDGMEYVEVLRRFPQIGS